MRFFNLLVALTLPFVGLAAKKSSAERFTDYWTKSQTSTPVKLKELSYKSVTSEPRDYSVAVLLTALESRFGCQLCHEFHPEWELLARSWTKGDRNADSRLLFGTLDFSDGREIFMSLGLQTAPVMLLFPPTTGPHATTSRDPLRFDFTSGPQKAEFVHAWISKHLPDRPHPPVKRPFNWIGWITTVTLVLGSVSAVTVAWPYIRPVVLSKRVWSALSLIAILLYTSGFMFNHIRKVPYVTGDGKGGLNYIAGGFQNQLGMETQLVAFLYGSLAFIAISLVSKVPRITDPPTQKIAIVAYSAGLMVMYSFLLSVFRIKNGGYPFALPPFM